MKKTLAFLLAALMLAGSLNSCGENGSSAETTVGETFVSETKSPETAASETQTMETDVSETEAPAAAYALDTVTENGIAKAHIVLLDGADELEKFASEELVYHIKLVSGADVTVTNEANSDSLPIIIATPDSLPELEELFPEDLSWLRDLGNPEEDVRYGDDGFAIRLHDNKIYIFGATPRGALNGVYDFIEDNMDVLWIRATNMNEYPIIYDEMPTITIDKTDYAVGHREKSPFVVRSMALGGGSFETTLMLSRNKQNISRGNNPGVLNIGMKGFLAAHNLKNWIITSPSYDPNNTEYWSTDSAGNHYTEAQALATDHIQTNFWSDVTMECVADSVIAYLDTWYESTGIQYIGISLADSNDISVYPEMREPYEYAPGQFVKPNDTNYISTVYFSFINKIAKRVAEKYPEVNIDIYAYGPIIYAPACDLEYNVYPTFCPLGEDLATTIDNPNRGAYLTYRNFCDWMEKTSNLQVRNYYCIYHVAPFYDRPIWHRMQSDMQLYAENGLNGVIAEGVGDIDAGYCTGYTINNERTEPYLNMANAWTMNAMTYWIYSKLAWNPYEDVDALIEYYCDKVYGEASEYMKEYLRLLDVGMKEGAELMDMEFNMQLGWDAPLETIWEYFLNVEVDGVLIIDAIKETLHKAYDAADSRAKAHMGYMVEVFDNLEYITWG